LNTYANDIGNADTLYNNLGTIVNYLFLNHYYLYLVLYFILKRKWKVVDFADRWLRQSNYPLVKIRTEKKADGKFYLNIQQSRFNSEYSIFTGDLYPSPYNWTW